MTYPRTKTDEPPAQRIKKAGTDGLRDHELLELLIGGPKALELSVKAQETIDRLGLLVGRGDLTAINGIGEATANRILAALELVRRMGRPQHCRVSCPADIVPRLLHWADRDQEVFLVVLLNGAQQVIEVKPVTAGLVNRTLIHPREVFAPAIATKATSVILAHNHPSGALEPSREDREATKRMADAGKLMGIEVLDHIILAPGGEFYSFRENSDVLI